MEREARVSAPLFLSIPPEKLKSLDRSYNPNCASLFSLSTGLSFIVPIISSTS